MSDRTRIELRGGQSILVEGNHDDIRYLWSKDNPYFFVTLAQEAGKEPGASGRIVTAAVDAILEEPKRIQPSLARGPVFPLPLGSTDGWAPLLHDATSSAAS